MNRKTRKVYIYKHRFSKHGVGIPYQRGYHELDFIARRDKSYFASREQMMRKILTPDEFQQWVEHSAYR